jgi:hypothetical protein
MADQTPERTDSLFPWFGTGGDDELDDYNCSILVKNSTRTAISLGEGWEGIPFNFLLNSFFFIVSIPRNDDYVKSPNLCPTAVYGHIRVAEKEGLGQESQRIE